MSLKTRTQQQKSTIKSNILKSYEQCLKQGISNEKTYGSDFIDDFIVERYPYPPYSWNINQLTSDNKKINKQHINEKSIQTSKKKIKSKSISKKPKSNASQRSKSKSKKYQRSKSQKR
ncbi:unnamed protein product [Rotaria sordida]|uniref:Uncharacterized protein n=1 Tax=Rotaria sordida TaxID=392033 RepID=A0A813NIM5_9BILA|nr:unnamed protein product [Rotaria sordida]CAF0770814.1 unnamed protein product [Rotaria sordida]CAF0823688.1 unnamed protein product [Rotaria sordida]CAF0886101.1 unnamed protein product [Rotaria sordida]CAF0886969.1 unnamed protein product [Rotaria sordida]